VEVWVSSTNTGNQSLVEAVHLSRSYKCIYRGLHSPFPPQKFHNHSSSTQLQLPAHSSPRQIPTLSKNYQDERCKRNDRKRCLAHPVQPGKFTLDAFIPLLTIHLSRQSPAETCLPAASRQGPKLVPQPMRHPEARPIVVPIAAPIRGGDRPLLEPNPKSDLGWCGWKG
jgi:hypothetical protein